MKCQCFQEKYSFLVKTKYIFYIILLNTGDKIKIINNNSKNK